MSNYRFVFSVLLISLSLSKFLPAQSMPGQWVGDLYMINRFNVVDGFARPPFAKILIDEKNTIHQTMPNIASAGADFPIEARYRRESMYSHWHSDALYTLASGDNERNEDGSIFKRWTFAKWEDDEWHFVGYYKTSPAALLKAIPCDNDRLIVISNFNALLNGNTSDPTPFAKMSVLPGRKELRLESFIDHGQDDLKKYMSSEPCFDLACQSDIILTDKFATVVNSSTGLFWVFSLEKASLVKAGKLFRRVTPEMIAKGGFSTATLAVNPEKEGTVLIASQDEDFFVNLPPGNPYMEMAEMRMNNPQMTQEVYRRLLDDALEQRKRDSPFVVWYRIYPENGKVEKLYDPPEGGTFYRSEMKNGLWWPMLDGSVKLGNLEGEIASSLLESQRSDKSDPAGEAKKEVINHTAPPLGSVVSDPKKIDTVAKIPSGV
ncbi:MAG: hypothetical protein FWG02_07100 [Holophagaceae bacterium]|nr:hypothetical protein [Holophagaceae bacterium]